MPDEATLCHKMKIVQEQILIGGQIRNTVRYYVVSNCGISKILQAIVHDGCPSQLAGKKLRGD